MIFAEWILGIIKTLSSNILQNPLPLTWNHQLLGFSTSPVMCVSYFSTCLAANYFQFSDFKKEINTFGVLLWRLSMYRVKHSIFFVRLSMVYKGWLWLWNLEETNVKCKNKPLHLFTNTWDLIPQVHKTRVPSSRWGSMCSKTKPNATAAPIKTLHQRTLKVYLVNTVNFICNTVFKVLLV